MLGKDQPVVLSLLEVPVEKAQQALKGVMMELEDCAFPLLAGMEAHSDPMTAFKDVDYALLIGSRPRGPGMERAELLAVNAEIFTAQGKALNAVASRDVKVLVVGNPWVTLFGFALVGAGLATVVPILYNAATLVPGTSRAAAIAAASSIGYGGFMLGPPLIGAIAHRGKTALQASLDGAREIGFTGGEPFMNAEIIPMLEAALASGRQTLVLTNAM
eukprot:gene40204-53131_t